MCVCVCVCGCREWYAGAVCYVVESVGCGCDWVVFRCCSVVFAGFSAEALRSRINDGESFYLLLTSSLQS